MRRIIFGIILVGIAVSAVAQMLMQPSAESDALFAAGVDLYNKGKYREAIPLFAKSDSLDKAQLDSTSNRRDYSSMCSPPATTNLATLPLPPVLMPTINLLQ